MRSGTSFFDLTLYRRTVNRFWPLWAVNLVLWLFVLPLNGLMQLGDDPYGSSRSLLRFARNVGDTATNVGILFSAMAGLAVAMAVCSHLYNSRSANFMGALPTRREGQFVSTYLAGLTMLIGPNLLVFLLTLLVEAVGGAVMMAPLLFWLGAMCAMEFFFFSFAVCLGQFTGHILVLPVYYGVFNFIAIAVYGLFQWFLEAYYFGHGGIADYDGWILWLTPIVALFQMEINVSSDIYSVSPLTDIGMWDVRIEGLQIVGVYALVAVVLTGCALLLYRRRQLESAGDIVAVRILRPVFRYGVGFCSGLFLGWLTQQILGLGQVGLMIVILIWGVIGCIVAQMLLDKTVRVFHKWKGCAALTVAFLLIFAVIGFDLTGYETRVPDPASVEYVEMIGLNGYPSDSGYSLGGTFTDPDTIKAITALHRAIVEIGEQGEVNGTYINFKVSYHLKSGRTLNRRYVVEMGETLLPLSQNIRDRYDVRRAAYQMDQLEEFLAQGGALVWATLYTDEQDEIRFYEQDAERVWNAVLDDFEAGTIGFHTVGDYGKQTEAVSQVQSGDRVYSSLRLEFNWLAGTGQNESSRYLEVAVSRDSEHTLEVLKRFLPNEEGQTLEEQIAGVWICEE